MTLSPELFAQYQADPVGCDRFVRGVAEIPDDRYYTVSIWPIAGIVRQSHLTRTVNARKISKSP